MPEAILEKPARLEEVLHDVAKIKETVTEVVDDGVRSAARAIKRGRYAAEDALADAKQAMRKNPLAAAGVIFASGMAAGALSVWIGMRRPVRKVKE